MTVELAPTPANRRRMTELPKTFDPNAIEERWYAHWEANGLFRPDRPDATPWTIVMPPPNVTGSLHIGHALDNTLQDVLTRRERMLGKDALVGGRHRPCRHRHPDGGRAQARRARAVKRAEIGREAFLEKVWEWKAESGGAITRQLRRLGARCDWAHERFTMDEGFSARRHSTSSSSCYKRGLHLSRQAPGELGPEVPDRDQRSRGRDRAKSQGKIWTCRYPLADGSGAHLGRDHAARDDARRHGGRGSPGGRALHARWSASRSRLPITGG